VRLPTPPAGGWPVIMADPPWSFATYSGAKVPQRAAVPHYQVMTLDALKALPVASVAAKDSMLFLWVLDSMIPQAIEVATAWGFDRYIKVGINWTKEKMGMGFWTRNDCELCLMFARGKPGGRLNANVRQTIFAEPSKHSQKPIETYDRVEALLPGPYLELFARADAPAYWETGERKDWTPWGLEAPGRENKLARLEDAVDALTRLFGNRFQDMALDMVKNDSELATALRFIMQHGKAPTVGTGQ
jgi:N6-adenosine-specific RNA methylase IME4